jgi:hypothetical protein
LQDGRPRIPGPRRVDNGNAPADRAPAKSGLRGWARKLNRATTRDGSALRCAEIGQAALDLRAREPLPCPSPRRGELQHLTTFAPVAAFGAAHRHPRDKWRRYSTGAFLPRRPPSPKGGRKEDGGRVDGLMPSLLP